MAFLGLMLRSGRRHRWRSWLALTLLTAVVVGLVLAGVQTARRTATAFPRFEAAHGYDTFFYSLNQLSRSQSLSLPGVASATVLTSVGTGSPTCDRCKPIDVNNFTLSEVPPDRLAHYVKLVSGRLPNQSDPDEILASDNLTAFGVHVGSIVRVPLTAASQRQAMLNSANIKAAGAVVKLHVVGLSVSEIEFPTTSSAPSYNLYTTQSFATRYNPSTVLLYEYFFQLRRGAARLVQFDAAARNAGGLAPTDLHGLDTAITTSIEPQAVGWWILTGLAALVGIIVLAQALARQTVVEADDYPTLDRKSVV